MWTNIYQLLSEKQRYPLLNAPENLLAEHLLMSSAAVH